MIELKSGWDEKDTEFVHELLNIYFFQLNNNSIGINLLLYTTRRRIRKRNEYTQEINKEFPLAGILFFNCKIIIVRGENLLNNWRMIKSLLFPDKLALSWIRYSK